MSRKEIQRSCGTGPSFFYGYVVVGALLIAIVAMWSPYYAFGVFFKQLLDEFGWTRALISGAFSIAMITQGLLSAVMGKLNDKSGPRVVIILCGCLLGLGYLLMSQIHAIWHFYLVYGLIIGTGMSGAFVPHMSTVAKWFITRRSLMTGIVASGSGIAILIGSPIATKLISVYNWRISIIIVGLLAVLLIVLSAPFLKRTPTQVGLQPYRGSEGETSELSPQVKSFSLKEALRTNQFWLVWGLCFCYGFCLFTITVHVIPFATDMGISAVGAASIMVIIGVMGIIGKIVVGGAGDRRGNKNILIFSFSLWVLAYLWVLIASNEWMLYLFAAAFGIAFGGNSTSHSPLVARLFGLSSHGLIYGVIGIGVYCGGALGPFLAGYIFDTTDTYQSAFMLCAVIGIVGIILTALLKPTKG
jgi:MFS family permease